MSCLLLSPFLPKLLAFIISTGTIMEVYLTAENVRQRSIGAVTFLFEPMDYEDLMSHKVLYPDVYHCTALLSSGARAQALQRFGKSFRDKNYTNMNDRKITRQNTDVRTCVGILNCLARKSAVEYQGIVDHFQDVLFPLQRRGDSRGYYQRINFRRGSLGGLCICHYSHHGFDLCNHS
jgi:hypothetical protein